MESPPNEHAENHRHENHGKSKNTGHQGGGSAEEQSNSTWFEFVWSSGRGFDTLKHVEAIFSRHVEII